MKGQQMKHDILKKELELYRSQIARAEKLVIDALAMRCPRLALVKEQRALLFCRSTYGQPYRVTDIDEHGPSGHREYSASDVRGIAQEIASALRGGFVVQQSNIA